MIEQAQTLRAQFLDLVLQARRDQAAVFLASLAGDAGYARVIRDILEPVLLEIGERWSRDRLSLAQGYVAGKIAEDAFVQMARHVSRLPGRRKGPAVLGNIEDDHHSLGRKMLVIFLEAAGWEIVNLGNDVLAEAFVDAAEEVGARVIGVSAMMLTTARSIVSVRRELDRRGLAGRIQLAVGGAVINLRPELTAEVGGDGTCANAILAPQLFDRLWAASLAAAGDSA